MTVTDYDRVIDAGILPVVVLNRAENAHGLGDALLAGGLPMAEVALRTEESAAALRILAARGDLFVAAGTVLSADQVDLAADAGATMIVCPGLFEPVVDRARELGLAIVPGVATASDLHRANDMGLTHVKFFPAGQLGGPAAIRALGDPFRKLSFLPSGGVSPSNAAEYLALANVFAISGSWMVRPDAIDDGRFDEIERLSRDTVALISGIRA